MARIAGVDLPREKRVEIGLTYIYGIGRATSNKILAEAGVNPDTRVRELTDEEVKKISEALEKLEVMVEGDLRREIALNIKRLQEIGCYRGVLFLFCLKRASEPFLAPLPGAVMSAKLPAAPRCRLPA